MPVIRPACLADADALAALAERTFRDTFASVNSPQDMTLHCRANYSPQHQACEIAAGDMMTLLCEDDGVLVGFAQLRWGRAPQCVVAESPSEIQRFYVIADSHGTGVAQALMNACLQGLQQRGSDAVWLGVWEHNPRAIAFYRKAGFFVVGEHVFTLGTDPQRDIVMSRTLPPA